MIDEQDVNSSESSSESNEQTSSDSTQSEATSSEENSSSEAAPAKSSEDNVPFHMHPRFQEVIQEKNALKEQTASFQRELNDLRQQLKASTPAEKDELMERLEKIDPQFGKLVKTMRDELKVTRQQLEELSGWRNQSSQETTQERVANLKTQFYTQNNIPEERKGIYEAMVRDQAAKNPKLQVSDLPQVMKQVHEQIGKMFQTVERATTKTFVDGKKAQAAKPATLPKGAPAQAKKQDKALSHEDLRAQMLKEAIDEVRGNKEI